MRHTPTISLIALGAALSLLAACGGGKPAAPDAFESCEAGKVDEGLRLAKAEAAEGLLTDEALGRCIAATVIAADERGEWKLLPGRIGDAMDLAPDEPGPDVTAAELEARAALAYALATERLCCHYDGLAQFQALLEQVVGQPAEQVDTVERWYGRTHEELLEQGQWVVDVEGRMFYAPTVGAVVPAHPEDAYKALLGKEVVLHNVLMMEQTHVTPTIRSGDRLDASWKGVDRVAHRVVVLRRPGAADGTPVTVVWGEAWDTLLDGLHPGHLHTCEGTVVEAQRKGQPQGLLVLQRCQEEAARTETLFHQRKCTVCGERDGEEVCRDGYGRNDGQAFQAASGPVCSELLHFDEVFEDCPKVVTMTRTCVNNDDPVPPAEEPATEPAAGATGAPPSDPH